MSANYKGDGKRSLLALRRDEGKKKIKHRSQIRTMPATYASPGDSDRASGPSDACDGVVAEASAAIRSHSPVIEDVSGGLNGDRCTPLIKDRLSHISYSADSSIHLLHLFDGRVYNLHCSSPPLVMHASCHVSAAALLSFLPLIFYPGTTKSDPFWLMILPFVSS